MKVLINVDENICENEIIIKCSKRDDTIQKLYESILDINATVNKLTFYKDNKSIIYRLIQFCF